MRTRSTASGNSTARLFASRSRRRTTAMWHSPPPPRRPTR
ncbi:hypothetical protein E2C01_087145 [Portunus trituberculatus]|uniref:Uncharacterized protein n=1 Tax=Portunus trituberculatus TaxID=210409 RepID=A0A5B7JCJ8_PORTR|nr:hypothetical protein [Portunus trituberculatus]